MKRILSIFFITLALTTCYSFAAKYKVNTSGTVKYNGKTVSPSVTTQTKTNVSVYNAQNYTSQNQVNYAPASVIELVMDYSGSMSNCISEAKKAMSSIVAQIPSTTKIGFRVFGYDSNGSNPPSSKAVASIIKGKNGKYKAVTKTDDTIGSTTGYCASTRQIVSLGQANSNSIISGMNSVSIGGATPMVYGLERAINQDFSGLSRSFTKKIVLITDGGENCGGDPCAYARQLAATRSDIQIDVVLVGSYSNKLSCLSSLTKGNFYTVNDLSNFSTVINEVINAPVTNTEVDEQQYEFYND